MATQLPSPDKSADLVDIQGKKVSTFWFNWFLKLFQVISFSGLADNQAANLPGLTVVIVTAKLTAIGANGSMTFTNGILTAQTPAT